jgi:hypothetical protein
MFTMVLSSSAMNVPRLTEAAGLPDRPPVKAGQVGSAG